MYEECKTIKLRISLGFGGRSVTIKATTVGGLASHHGRLLARMALLQRAMMAELQTSSATVNAGQDWRGPVGGLGKVHESPTSWGSGKLSMKNFGGFGRPFPISFR